MKRELTDAFLRGVEPPAEGRLELRDTKVPGLVLRITPKSRMNPKGLATWSVRTRTKDGKQTRPKLGTWPILSIGAARKAARDMLAAIQTGDDPAEKWRQARAERRSAGDGAGSVENRLAEWQAIRERDPLAPWSPRYSAEVRRIVDREILPSLGTRDLKAMTRAEWVSLVTKKRAGSPAVAAMLYRTISSFLNFAEASGWIDAVPLPRKGVATLAPPPAPRERVLSDAELVAVWRAADREAPKLRAFVRLLILTAARELEVADMAAGEVDREAGRWTIPGSRTKNGTGYVVPLAGLALAELAAVWPNVPPEPVHLLLGRNGGGGGFRGFSKLKARLDVASKVEGWRFHDLRRTARTGMTRLGVPRDHAEAAINHLSGRSKLERTYDRHDYGPEIIAALSTWQGHVAGLVGAAAELVPLAERRAAK
jgi:integrase